jgi:hypothetical protein
MNEIAEKHFKYTGPRKRVRVKEKVKAKTITKQYLPYLQLEKLFKMSAVISNTRLCPSMY